MRRIELVAERQIAYAQFLAMLANHLPPGAAAHRERGFTRQIGQILVSPEQMAETFGAFDSPRGSGQLPQGQCLKIQVFHAVPPAMQNFVVRVFSGLFHQATAAAVATGMLLKHLFSGQCFNAEAVDEQAKRVKLMTQVG